MSHVTTPCPAFALQCGDHIEVRGREYVVLEYVAERKAVGTTYIIRLWDVLLGYLYVYRGVYIHRSECKHFLKIG